MKNVKRLQRVIDRVRNVSKGKSLDRVIMFPAPDQGFIEILR